MSRLKSGLDNMKIKPPSSRKVLVISMIAFPDMLLFNDPSGIPGLFVGVIYDTISEYLNPS